MAEVSGESGVYFLGFARQLVDRKRPLLLTDKRLRRCRHSVYLAYTLIAKDSTKYRVAPDPQGDVAAYVRIGLLAVEVREESLKLIEVPALLHYKIDDYDGQQSLHLC